MEKLRAIQKAAFFKQEPDNQQKFYKEEHFIQESGKPMEVLGDTLCYEYTVKKLNNLKE